jgi:hypothetical protein
MFRYFFHLLFVLLVVGCSAEDGSTSSQTSNKGESKNNSQEVKNQSTDESREKFFQNQLLGFAERGISTLEREHKLELEKEEAVLRKFARGELSREEYQEYLDQKSQAEQRETEEAFAMLKDMYDPEKGMLSGVMKLANDPSNRKSDQQRKLDKEIKEIIADIGSVSNQAIITRLHLVAWAPVGDPSIDQEMTDYYEKKIERAIESLKAD